MWAKLKYEEERCSSKLVSTSLATLLLVLSVCVICGWIYRIPLLKGAAFGTFVAPGSALLFAVCAISVVLQENRFMVWIGRILGAAVALFAVATFSQYITGRDFGVDRWFLSSRLSDWQVDSPPGRIALPTTFAFVNAGIASFWLKFRTRGVVDVAVSMQLTVAYLAIVGQMYGVQPLYGYVMAIPTPFLISLQAIMLLAAARVSHIRDTLLSDGAGGVMVRRLAPLALFVLPALGWLRILLEARGVLPARTATAILVLTFVVIFTVSSFRTASWLNRVDAERKAAQSALIRSEKLAAVGRLASTIAHEINNPLSAAMNALYLARTMPDQSNEYVALADAALIRVSAVARRSLSFYRGSPSSANISVEAAVTDVVDLFRPMARTQGISIDGSSEASLTVVADAGELRQIVMNLVVNAIDATPQGGTVQVRSYLTSGEKVAISVRDTGAGVPDHLRDRIFEPFFTTKSATGTGLGLHIVKELVTKYRGELQLDSSSEGSCFTVLLPRAQVRPAETKAHAQPSSSSL